MKRSSGTAIELEAIAVGIVKPDEGIAPGDYKIFSWETLEPYRYFDQEFIREVEDRGVAVTVTSPHDRTSMRNSSPKIANPAAPSKLYAVYGPFYDATQGPRDGANYIRLLRQHHPRARTLLEIACGTGANLVPLSKHYAVTGLDVSPTMLRYARAKLPGVELYCQNMAGFELGKTFDAVICPYDSINHLLSFKDWVRTFKAAKRHLNPGGVFIFDINTKHRLEALAKAPAGTKEFDGNYMIMKVSMSALGVADWDVRVFERLRSGRYRLHQEVIKERSFEHERIRGSLKACFKTVRGYDLAGWGRPKRSSGRLYYVCR